MTTLTEASRLPGELGSKLLAQAPRWIFLLLFLLVMVRGAVLLGHLAGASTNPVNRGPQPAIPPVTRKVVDIPSILRANLFGQPPQPVGADAPVTTMNLKLILTFADFRDEKLGLAAIGPSLTDVKMYRVGDSVPGGALLHAVHVDKVLLNRGGAIESLPMPLRTGQTAPPPAALNMPVNPALSAARVQQAVRDNPNLINQVMQRQPVFADGKLRGMRVNPGPNAQAFTRLGLRPQDIITAINGTPLDNQARSTEIFNTLGSSAEAQVTVDRNGQVHQLTLNLAEIANEAERLANAPPEPPPPEPPAGPDSER